MVEINESNFATETESGVVLLDFYTPWCGPCRLMEPIVSQITGAKVCKVNAEFEPNLSKKFHVMNVPTFIFMKDGVENTRLIGSQTKAKIQSKIDELNQ